LAAGGTVGKIRAVASSFSAKVLEGMAELIKDGTTEKTILFDINEADSFFLFAVSDGLGGEIRGDEASLTAMRELKKAHNLIKTITTAILTVAQSILILILKYQ